MVLHVFGQIECLKMSCFFNNVFMGWVKGLGTY